MNGLRIARCLACFALLFAVLVGLLGGSVVLAAEEDSNGPILSPPTQEEPQSEEPPIKFTCKFPTIEGVAGDTFEFRVFIEPTAKEYAGKWDFNVITPHGWKASVWQIHLEQEVASMDFSGQRGTSDTVKVKASSLSGERPEPGEYVITLEMESGDLKVSIDLTAVVTASYEFDIDTATGRLNSQVKAGEDNHISILLTNTGTAAIEDITFSSSKPEGWSTTYNPEKIDSLEPGLKREVDVVMKPPKRTIAGDYFITLKAESEHGSDSLQLRVTVVTPKVLEWAGIGIAVGVIVGLGVLFSRLRMR
jgi:uncharacterized membrane protein